MGGDSVGRGGGGGGGGGIGDDGCCVNVGGCTTAATDSSISIMSSSFLSFNISVSSSFISWSPRILLFYLFKI